MELNFKYEGMLAHSFDRFYVVTKFILSSVNDLKFSTINFNETCDYLQEKNECNENAKEYISDLSVFCKKIVPFVHYYKEQIFSFNCTLHNILMNEISPSLLNLLKDRKEKRGIIISQITGFIGLAYEGISSFLHNRRLKALYKAVVAMENKVYLQLNKLIYLEDSMVMYGVYNTETLEKLITTIHKMYNITTPHERLFAGKLSSSFVWYLTKNGVHHYAINTLLHLRTLREKIC